jgi:hypothetical protein
VPGSCTGNRFLLLSHCVHMRGDGLVCIVGDFGGNPLIKLSMNRDVQFRTGPHMTLINHKVTTNGLGFMCSSATGPHMTLINHKVTTKAQSLVRIQLRAESPLACSWPTCPFLALSRERKSDRSLAR